MKPTSLIINIPNPCSENWDEMTPEARGRFCASCQKTVIDFTHFTDAQILAFWKADKGAHLCGYYHPSQLNREIVSVKPPRSFGVILAQRIAASFLFFQTLANTAFAQTVKPKAAQHTTTKQTNSTDKKWTIKGYVKDQNTELPISGVFVGIAGSDMRTITDSAGRFSLSLPHTFAEPTIDLQVRYTPAQPQPRNTFIEDKILPVDGSLFASEITFYRTTGMKMNDVVNAQQPPKLNAYQHTGGSMNIAGGPGEGTLYIIDGVEVQPTPAPKPQHTFFQKIGSWFKRKK